MKLFRPTHLSRILAFTVIMLSSPAICAPAFSTSKEEKITTAKAVKLQKYIEKAFSKIDEAKRPAYKDMLVARLHVCALVNKLLSENNFKARKKKPAYSIRYGTFTKLIAAMSESYPKDKTESFAAQASSFIKNELKNSDSAKLQITFNSCIDIHAGKITHALSNMDQQKAATASGG